MEKEKHTSHIFAPLTVFKCEFCHKFIENLLKGLVIRSTVEANPSFVKSSVVSIIIAKDSLWSIWKDVNLSQIPDL